jgi:hypothetical protein
MPGAQFFIVFWMDLASVMNMPSIGIITEIIFVYLITA